MQKSGWKGREGNRKWRRMSDEDYGFNANEIDDSINPIVYIYIPIYKRSQVKAADTNPSHGGLANRTMPPPAPSQ